MHSSYVTDLICYLLLWWYCTSGAEYVPAREWMRICFELLEMLKAHKKGIRRATVNTFGYIAKVHRRHMPLPKSNASDAWSVIRLWRVIAVVTYAPLPAEGRAAYHVPSPRIFPCTFLRILSLAAVQWRNAHW